MIAVIDYGMGNLRSVQKALDDLGAKAKITSSPKDIEACEKLVFPGVGAFGEAMKELKARKLVEPIKNAIADNKPFLGLCLGLQLLFEKSEEDIGVKGLCVLKGESTRFRTKDLKVPHMGWNSIDYPSTSLGTGRPKTIDHRPKILNGIPRGSYMYFVHSYYVKPKDPGIVITTTDYGIKFASGIRKDNIYAFQFHPEKSQGLGLRILKNFVNL